MSTDTPRHQLRLAYERWAQEYLRSLPPEHFMEATPQGTQRKITLESLDLVHARRPEVQLFNELLVQYPYGRAKRPHQVVPDNMVVVYPEPIEAGGSYDVPLQPVGPYWVLEYVSRHSERKDYDESLRKYERELKVPYYLGFHPEDQELLLFRHTGRRYRSVTPNGEGRHPIPELGLEVALLGGWVRFWFEGKLLPLPGDMQRELDELSRRLRAAEERARGAEERAEEERRQKERLLARLRELGIEPDLH
ncbi:MAG TPA: Uma2 family endonuclease [Gemmataceae bacterium]|nr:Uma2 family endonuclease [Gemmataceae bacterium]